MVTPPNFSKAFHGRRVILTGHTGFKGSWLALWLHQLGAEVFGYALDPEGTENHFTHLGLDGLITHEVGDIRDQDHVLSYFDDVQPEIVFHLAAQPLVRYSYAEPKETFDVNVGGSVNILEGCRLTPSVRALVYVTSDKCYRNNEWTWGYRENDELGGHDPYSASKAAAELVFSSYFDSFFDARDNFGAASVRAGNVIGGGDWAQDRIVPDCIRALKTNQPINVRNPASTRPWQHVLEPLSGYLEIAARLMDKPCQYSGAWNFGPDTRSVLSVGALVETLIDQWGSGAMEHVVAPKGNPHEANLLHLNCDKAHQQLGWWPKWSAEEAISATVDWYKFVAQKQPALEISNAQIQSYMRT